MKNLNNINYSLEDAEELSKTFQSKKNKPLIRKPKNFNDNILTLKFKGKRRRNKRYDDTFSKRDI